METELTEGRTIDMDVGAAEDEATVAAKCCTSTGVAGVMKDNRVSFPSCDMLVREDSLGGGWNKSVVRAEEGKSKEGVEQRMYRE